MRISPFSWRRAAVLAAAVSAGLGASQAWAQSPNWTAWCERPDQGMLCAQPYSEGLAAFRAGPHGTDEADGRWGFVDREGRVVIEPAFVQVGAFSNGLAAAAEAPDAWGYIDATGAWAIPPTLRRASPFNAAGTAIVETAERNLQVIARDGKLVRALPREAWLGGDGFAGGELASLRVPSAPLLWRVSERRTVRLPAGAAAVEDIGADWLLVRPERRGGPQVWGYASFDGEWEVAPGSLASERPPLRDGEVVAVYRDEGWRFVGLDGEALADAVYPQAERVAPGTWLVRDAAGAWQVLDAALAVAADLGKTREVRGTGDWRVLQGEAGAWLAGPQAQVRKLADGAVNTRIESGVFWVFDAAQAERERRVRHVIDAATGASLLDEDTLAELQQRRVTVLGGTSAAPPGQPGILALLLPDEARQSDEAPAAEDSESRPAPALLNTEGRILSDPQWRSVQTAGVPGLARATLHDGLTGLVDAEEQWRLAPEFERIGEFTDGLALARLPAGDGATRPVLVSDRGERFDVPTRILEQAVRLARGFIVYTERVDGEARTGLWDVRAGQVRLEPRALELDGFAGEYALARSPQGWGVMDADGAWRLNPELMGKTRPRTLGGALFVVPVSGDGGGDTHYRLFNAATGRALEELLSREPAALGEGHWLLTLRQGGVLIVDDAGHVLLRERRVPQTSRRAGDWVVLAFEDRYGAIDSRGEWRVQPDYAAPLHFVAPLGYASVYGDGRYALLDAQGRELLPEFPGAQPIPGMMRLAWSRAYAKETLLLEPEGRRVAVLPTPNALNIGAGANGWVPYREGAREGFIDDEGRRVMGAHFDDLGPWRDGRAHARRKDVSGPLFGYIDETGRYAISPRFDWAQPFAQERAWVIERGVLSLIDRDGQVLLRSMDRCEHRVLVDAGGAVRWPADLPACDAASQNYGKARQ